MFTWVYDSIKVISLYILLYTSIFKFMLLDSRISEYIRVYYIRAAISAGSLKKPWALGSIAFHLHWNHFCRHYRWMLAGASAHSCRLHLKWMQDFVAYPRRMAIADNMCSSSNLLNMYSFRLPVITSAAFLSKGGTSPAWTMYSIKYRVRVLVVLFAGCCSDGHVTG